MLPRALIALAAVAAGALSLGSSPANAAPYYEVEYAVSFDVTAKWDYAWSDVDDYPKRTFDGGATATFSGSIDDVVFRNGQLLNIGAAGPVTAPTVTGSGLTVTTTWDSVRKREDVTHGVCAPAAFSSAGDVARLERQAEQGSDTEEALQMRLVSSLPVAFGCTSGHEAGADLAWNGKAYPDSVFDAWFELPHEAIGMGKIIQNVHGSVANSSPQFCPGQDAHTTKCTFSWTGQITFTKVQDWQYGIEPLPSQGGVDPRAQAVSDAVAQYGHDPRAEAISKAVAQYGAEPEIDVRAQIISDAVKQYGQELRFKAGCEAGCSGTAVITPVAGKKPLAYSAAQRALARLSFRVPAGKPRTIRVKLPAKARKALRRSGGSAVVAITLRPKGGAPKTVKLRLERGR